MSLFDDETLPSDEQEPVREGAFDAQLSFGPPFAPVVPPITTIRKRDGRELPFDKGKIADSIFRAAESIGGHDRDRAQSLASGVAIYLEKQTSVRPPTVDHVSDAVEKVLIEMGHAKTALAYARFRDKRARMRRLRSGGLRAVLKELKEAEGGVPAEGEPRPRLSLFVRTSNETLAEWNRARIVDALVRETGLEPGVAGIVAAEVEQQLASADVKTLTASLVRELVDAKLVEHGLEDFRRKHMRLGVPLYDTERIICVPNHGELEGPHDPSTTDLVLAERVKREYALTQVFSQEVADAHLGGDLQIHGLGFVDRLHAMDIRLERAVHFGFLAPPSDGCDDGIIARIGRLNAALHAHLAGPLCWRGLNVSLGRHLAGCSSDDMAQLARMLLLALDHDAPARLASDAGTSVELSWPVSAPQNGDAPAGKGTPLKAREFAAALFDTFAQAGRETHAGVAPAVLVREQDFAAVAFRAFLERAATIGRTRRGIRIAFHRGGSTDEPAPDGVVAHCVTLNLPRLAFRASGAAFDAELERLAGLAVKAHAEKRAFLERLVTVAGLGPLDLLLRERDGRRFVDLQTAVYSVGVAGLNECVERLCGRQLHESEDAIRCGASVLTRLAERCREKADAEDLCVALCANADPRVENRFATVDLQQYPIDARAVCKADRVTQDVTYTRGAAFAGDAGVTPMCRATQEGRLHEHLDGGAITHVCLGSEEMSEKALADLVESAHRRTRAQGLTFRREG